MLLAVCPLAVSAPKPPPNIIVLLADDMGYSDIAPFGSEIATPALTRLAAEGCLLTNLHTTPAGITRAEILSGADHHLVGMSAMYAAAGKQLGTMQYQRFIDDRALSIAELLRDGGYHTYLVGRWGLGTTIEHGPQARGFEESFDAPQAANDQISPSRTDPKELKAGPVWREHDRPTQIPSDAYSTTFLTDKLIAYIEKHRQDGKPFLAWLGYTVPHFPLQAPDSDLAHQAGRYDAGYDAIRLARIERQKRLGVIARNFRPSSPAPALPGREAWAQLDPAARRLEARRMEIYAAMIANMDANIGRLFAYLRAHHLYDNSLIIFLAGNGAATGFPLHRSVDYVNNSPDNLGYRDSYLFYSARWAEVSDAPFSLWKAKGNEGAISVPAIIRLPHISATSCIRREYVQARDLPATILETSHIANPGNSFHGHPVAPMSGVSLVPLLRGAVHTAHASDELFAGETSAESYVRRGPWKAVLDTPFEINFNETADAKHIPRMDLSREAPLGWRLYDIDRDRGETTDLAAQNPAVLQGLIDSYNEYANRVGVTSP